MIIKEKYKRKILLAVFYCWFMAFCAYLFAVFNIQYGRDYMNYLWAFEHISMTRFEYSFILLLTVIKDFFYLDFLNGMAIIIFNVIFFKLLILLKVSHSVRRFLLVSLLYILSYFLLHELTQFRLSIALLFILTSVLLLQKNHYLLSTLMILIGTSFHNSVIIFSIAPFVVYLTKKIRLKKIIFLSVIVMTISYFTMPLISDYIILYRKSATGYFENWHNYDIKYITLAKVLFYLLVIISIKVYLKERNIIFNTVFIYMYICFCVAFIFTVVPEISIRLYDIANMMSIYLFASIKFRKTFINMSYHLVAFFIILYRVLAFTLYKPLF